MCGVGNTVSNRQHIQATREKEKLVQSRRLDPRRLLQTGKKIDTQKAPPTHPPPSSAAALRCCSDVVWRGTDSQDSHQFFREIGPVCGAHPRARTNNVVLVSGHWGLTTGIHPEAQGQNAVDHLRSAQMLIWKSETSVRESLEALERNGCYHEILCAAPLFLQMLHCMSGLPGFALLSRRTINFTSAGPAHWTTCEGQHYSQNK